MKYKTRVPVCGAIMLNNRWDKVRVQHNTAGNSIAYVKAVLCCSAYSSRAGGRQQDGDFRRARSTSRNPDIVVQSVRYVLR